MKNLESPELSEGNDNKLDHDVVNPRDRCGMQLMRIGFDRDNKVTNNKIIPIINDATRSTIEQRESA
jgi:hypothetical protein